MMWFHLVVACRPVSPEDTASEAPRPDDVHTHTAAVLRSGTAEVDADGPWLGTESLVFTDDGDDAPSCVFTWQAADWAHADEVSDLPIPQPEAPCVDPAGTPCAWFYPVWFYEGTVADGRCDDFGLGPFTTPSSGPVFMGWHDAWDDGLSPYPTAVLLVPATTAPWTPVNAGSTWDGTALDYAIAEPTVTVEGR